MVNYRLIDQLIHMEADGYNKLMNKEEDIRSLLAKDISRYEPADANKIISKPSKLLTASNRRISQLQVKRVLQQEGETVPMSFYAQQIPGLVILSSLILVSLAVALERFLCRRSPR